MTPTAIQKGNEYYGAVLDSKGQVIYQTATTSIDRIFALKHARKWIKEDSPQAIEERRKAQNNERVKAHYSRVKKVKRRFRVGDVVKTPKGLGVVQGCYNSTVDVKVSKVVRCFLLEQVAIF